MSAHPWEVLSVHTLHHDPGEWGSVPQELNNCSLLLKPPEQLKTELYLDIH